MEWPPSAVGCPPWLVWQGTFPGPLLVDLARQFQADAVMFLCLYEFQPYAPPRVGVTVHLVSTREAITIASVDGVMRPFS